MPDRASRRFIAAVLASALVHALITGAVKPGTPGGQRPYSAPRVGVPIAVRVLPPEREPPMGPAAQPASPKPAKPPQMMERRTEAPASPPAPAAQEPNSGPSEIPDPTYYAARQLDTYPALLTPFHLSSDAQTATSGRIVLLVSIDAMGIVEEVSVVEGERDGHFADTVRGAFRAARFRPGRKNGRAVKSRIVVEIDNGASTPTGIQSDRIFPGSG